MTDRFELSAGADIAGPSGQIDDGGVMTLFTRLFEGLTKAHAPDAVSRALSINCDFVGPIEPGETLTGQAQVTRATRSVMFMSAEIKAGSRFIATANAVYKLLV
ncbi:MAG: hotdog domain-containing protein [Parvibaculum sp.]